MTERQRRRSSIVSSLQTFGKNPLGSHRRDATVNTSQNASIAPPPVTLESTSSSYGNSNKASKPYRNVSMPLPSVPIDPKQLEDEKGPSRLRRLRLGTPRLPTPFTRSSSNNSNNLITSTNYRHRTVSNQEYTTCTKQSRSRIPTPTKRPDVRLYSHEIYQREGRRSVLSSLGRRYTSLKRHIEKNQDNRMEKNKENSKQVEYGSGTGTGTGPAASFYTAPPQSESLSLSNNVLQAGKPHTLIPLPSSATSTSLFRKPGLPASRTRHSLPSSFHNGQRPIQQPLLPSTRPRGMTTGEGRRHSLGPDNDIKTNPPTPIPYQHQEQTDEMTGKVRVRSHVVPEKERRRFLSKPFMKEEGPQHQPPGAFAPTMAMEAREMINTRLKPTSEDSVSTRFYCNKSLESMNLKKPAMTAADIPMPKPTTCANRTEGQRPHSYSLTSPGYSNYNAIASSRTQERSSRKDQTEKMVTNTQPSQYWLGRLVTLTNAIHYEDSFNAPDSATGFGMLSCYSRPSASPIGGSCGSLVDRNRNLAGYRVKRAFAVLENACVTDEARRSLAFFREQYIGVNGDRWMA